MSTSPQAVKKIARRAWPLGVALAFLVLVALAWALASDWDRFGSLGDAVTSLGTAAPVLYVGLFAIGTVILAPSPVISIAAGVAFGWWGIPLALLGATLGAVASFLLSRYFLRETLDDWLSERATFRAAKTAVDEEGWKVLVLLRLSPAVPFGLLNYLAGLTKVPLTLYVLTTVIGITPGTVVDIHIGVIGAEAAGGAQIAYLVVGLVATAVVALAITWKARSYLREEGVKV
jgi:uncharacterized membrane protein YdjX (TVP38/TMEM64 family)